MSNMGVSNPLESNSRKHRFSITRLYNISIIDFWGIKFYSIRVLLYILGKRKGFTEVQAPGADSGAVDRPIHLAILPICVAYHMRRESLREQDRVAWQFATKYPSWPTAPRKRYPDARYGNQGVQKPWIDGGAKHACETACRNLNLRAAFGGKGQAIWRYHHCGGWRCKALHRRSDNSHVNHETESS